MGGGKTLIVCDDGAEDFVFPAKRGPIWGWLRESARAPLPSLMPWNLINALD
jgi:hypothetical protein